MDVNSPFPDENILRRMTYSELKKVAKTCGIKSNVKAEKLISELLSLSSNEFDMFSTPEHKKINSSTKNKENKFDEDMKTPLATPRRGTYSVESSPENLNGNKFGEKMKTPLATPHRGTYSVESSPENNLNKENTFDKDKMTRRATPRRSTYSVELSPKNYLVDEVITDSSSSPGSKSPMDISNVTICRGSDRKLRPRKVSFMSPKMTPRTPKYISLKDRPKTPIPSRNSSGRKVSFSSPTPVKQINISHNSTKNTPHSEISSSAPKESSKVNTANKQKKTATPSYAIKETSQVNKANKLKRTATPSNAVKEASQVNTATKLKRTATPSNAQKEVSDTNTASKLKRVATPNFQRIHEKAFNKMESLDDYHKRKLLTSAKKIAQISKPNSKVTKPKSKIPMAFSGIPFIPTATSCAGLKFTFASTVPKFTGVKKTPIPQSDQKSCSALKIGEKERVLISKENISTRSKKKFDLKASLSRKLGYKPYTGPLKPLAETGINSPTPSCYHTLKEGANKVVHIKRSQNRVALRGVRTNKRFELQMKNRKVE